MRGAVIDPVLDWDNRSGEAHTGSADAVLRAAEAEGVAVDWVLETHVHADHLTAAPYVKSRTGGVHRHRRACARCADHFPSGLQRRGSGAGVRRLRSGCSTTAKNSRSVRSRCR